MICTSRGAATLPHPPKASFDIEHSYSRTTRGYIKFFPLFSTIPLLSVPVLYSPNNREYASPPSSPVLNLRQIFHCSARITIILTPQIRHIIAQESGFVFSEHSITSLSSFFLSLPRLWKSLGFVSQQFLLSSFFFLSFFLSTFQLALASTCFDRFWRNLDTIII